VQDQHDGENKPTQRTAARRRFGILTERQGHRIARLPAPSAKA
jgi:hypothetical protein